MKFSFKLIIAIIFLLNIHLKCKNIVNQNKMNITPNNLQKPPPIFLSFPNRKIINKTKPKTISLKKIDKFINLAMSAYNINELKPEIWTFLKDARTNLNKDVYAFMAKDDKDKILGISMAGSKWKNILDLLTDFRKFKDPYPLCNGCMVDKRFYEKYKMIEHKLDKILLEVKKKYFDYSVFIIGHSIGGPMAVFYANHIKAKYKIESITCTLGSPRIGNESFRKFTHQILPVENVYRLVYQRDPITFVPKRKDGYFHVGNKLKYLSENKFVKEGLDDIEVTSPLFILYRNHHKKYKNLNLKKLILDKIFKERNNLKKWKGKIKTGIKSRLNNNINKNASTNQRNIGSNKNDNKLLNKRILNNLINRNMNNLKHNPVNRQQMNNQYNNQDNNQLNQNKNTQMNNQRPNLSKPNNQNQNINVNNDLLNRKMNGYQLPNNINNGQINPQLNNQNYLNNRQQQNNKVHQKNQQMNLQNNYNNANQIPISNQINQEHLGNRLQMQKKNSFNNNNNNMRNAYRNNRNQNIQNNRVNQDGHDNPYQSNSMNNNQSDNRYNPQNLNNSYQNYRNNANHRQMNHKYPHRPINNKPLTNNRRFENDFNYNNNYIKRNNNLYNRNN